MTSLSRKKTILLLTITCILLSLLLIYYFVEEYRHFGDAIFTKEPAPFNTMSDIELVKRMFNGNMPDFMYPSLETRIKSCDQIVYGEIISAKMNRKEVIRNIEENKTGPVFSDITVKVSRQYPADSFPTTIQFKCGWLVEPPPRMCLVLFGEPETKYHGTVYVRCISNEKRIGNVVDVPIG